MNQIKQSEQSNSHHPRKADMTNLKAALAERITAYLSGGGLFNPELADHAEVSCLLMECRAALQEAEPAAAEGQAGWKWVPIEPTREMVRACMHNDNGGLVTPEYRKAIYRAMLAAVDVQEPT
jgi:hypothetical protein